MSALAFCLWTLEKIEQSKEYMVIKRHKVLRHLNHQYKLQGPRTHWPKFNQNHQSKNLETKTKITWQLLDQKLQWPLYFILLYMITQQLVCIPWMYVSLALYQILLGSFHMNLLSHHIPYHESHYCWRHSFSRHWI